METGGWAWHFIVIVQPETYRNGFFRFSCQPGTEESFLYFNMVRSYMRPLAMFIAALRFCISFILVHVKESSSPPGFEKQAVAVIRHKALGLPNDLVNQIM